VGTGLIFAAVVIAWAVFLVPWALRRYDEATRARSVDKFSKAMRLLGRGQPAEPEPMTEEELNAEADAIAARQTVRPEPTVEAPVEPAHRPTREAARAAAQRRRRVLLMLLGATGLVAALAVSPLLPAWSVFIPVALIVAFLALCRWQVRREDESTWDVRRASEDAYESDEASPSADSASADSASDSSASDKDSDGSARRHAVQRHAVEADATPVGDEDLAESTSVAVTVSTEDGRSLWDPLPVTLPTYVAKAKATRTVRTIDLGQPDAWTSGHVEGEQTVLPSETTASGADSDPSSDADAGEAHRRAVGD